MCFGTFAGSDLCGLGHASPPVLLPVGCSWVGNVQEGLAATSTEDLLVACGAAYNPWVDAEAGMVATSAEDLLAALWSTRGSCCSLAVRRKLCRTGVRIRYLVVLGISRQVPPLVP